MKWYVAMVETGRELEARRFLQQAGLPAKVPQERRPVRSGGAWADKDYVLLPGYVFVGREDFDAADYYTLRETPGYLKLLGPPPPHPQAISYLEAEYINLLAPTDESLAPSVVEGGEVVDGVLLRIPGSIVKLDTRRKRAKVELNLLGEKKLVEFCIQVQGAPDEAAADGND